MKAIHIKIDRLVAFNKLRKGPAGRGKFGGFAFKDKTKYSRKNKHRARESD